jgi:hypothetical protein
MSYVSLWSVGYRVKAALTVTIVATTDKAVQFEVADNPKIKLWFPAKAVTEVSEGQFKIAHWFSFNEFTRNVFDRYASHY